MQSKSTAKDFFLFLGVLIGLYVSSITFLMLTFSIIDKVLPLAGDYVGQSDGTIRSAIAALIIFFPAFIYLSYITNKELQANPEKRDFWMRKWMIFFTLFVTGLAMAIDLVILVQRFLGADDLSLRFFLKVILVFIVSIVVFRSSLYDLKRTDFEFKGKVKTKIIIVAVVILMAIIYGIVLIGSPAMQRAKMMDERRVNDLSSIQSQIVYTQWENKGTVPTSLDALKDPISNYLVPTDPETGTDYTYNKISKNSFELCATFKTITSTTTSNAIIAKPVSYPYGTDLANENWQHKATTTCFKRVIDEKLYPLNKNKI
jgi:hypothetical protein